MFLISIISYFTFFRAEPIGSLSRAIPVLFPCNSRTIQQSSPKDERRTSEGRAKDEREDKPTTVLTPINYKRICLLLSQKILQAL